MDMLSSKGSVAWKCCRPLIVVVGSTGTGKTKLAVEIAEKFDGEVLSADSMQLYRGLPIGTNQATPEETRNIPHHMIGTLDPLTFAYNVTRFRDEALPILEKLWDRGKLPVVAGGTMQYVEGLLWDNLLDIEYGKDKVDYGAATLPEEIRTQPTDQLYTTLKKLDPHSASFTDSGNRRRILRALEVHFITGKSWEKLKNEQHSGENSLTGGPLRFPNTKILWLHTQPEVLEDRLRKRIDGMVEAGLEREITEFFDSHSEKYFAKIKELSELGVAEKDALDKGIFQSIALKEFREFLALTPEARKSDSGKSLFATGTEKLLIATRKYAKRQIKWIRRRFLLGTGEPEIFKLDSSDPSEWEDRVGQPSTEIVKSLLLNEKCSIIPERTSSLTHEPSDLRRVYYCDACERDVAGIVQWKSHLKGKGHKYLASKAKRKELRKLQMNLKMVQDIKATDASNSCFVDGSVS